MPIYDFECSACGHKAEVMRKVSAASTETCPMCQRDTFSKQVSAPSFQLNGTGWYATDFKNNGSKPSAPKSAEVATSEGSSGEAKSAEAKPAAACKTGCACH